MANSIIEAVKKGELQKDDALPSLNELSSEFDISRDTVERGYRHLKEIGVLGEMIAIEQKGIDELVDKFLK